MKLDVSDILKKGCPRNVKTFYEYYIKKTNIMRLFCESNRTIISLKSICYRIYTILQYMSSSYMQFLIHYISLPKTGSHLLQVLDQFGFNVSFIHIKNKA